jgi:hypothetical protein
MNTFRSLLNPIFCLSIVLFFTSVDLKSGTVQGRVISSNGEALEAASAYLLPVNQQVPLNDDGMYEINGIPSGDYYIAIVHPGYHLFLAKVSVNDEKPSQVVFVMRPEKQSLSSDYDQLTTELEKILLMCSAKKLSVVDASYQAKHKTEMTNSTHNIEVRKEVLSAIPETANRHNEKIGESEIEAIHKHEYGGLVTSVSVVPNPSSDFAIISFKLAEEGKVILELFRLQTGERIVLEDFGKMAAGENSVQLNISSLPIGTYTVLIRVSTCQYALTTFVKN